LNTGPYLVEGISADLYKEILLSNFQKISGLKLPQKPHLLGNGFHGFAFDIGGDKILKMTDDEKEAATSAFISKKNISGLWKVFSVWEFSGMKVWVIIGEKLKIDRSRAEALMKKLEKAAQVKAEASTTAGYADSELSDILVNLDGDKDATEIAFAMNALRNAGVKFWDLHAGNIAFRGNKPVIIDLGESISSGGKIGVFEWNL